MPEIAKAVESAKVTKSPGSELVEPEKSEAKSDKDKKSDEDEKPKSSYTIEHTSTRADRRRKKLERQNRRINRRNKRKK